MTREVSPDRGRPLQGGRPQSCAGRRERSWGGARPPSARRRARATTVARVLPQPRPARATTPAAEAAPEASRRAPRPTPRVYADGSALSRYLVGAPCRDAVARVDRRPRGRAGHDAARPDRAAPVRPAARRRGDGGRARRRGARRGRSGSPTRRCGRRRRCRACCRRSSRCTSGPRWRTRTSASVATYDVQLAQVVGPARAHRRLAGVAVVLVGAGRRLGTLPRARPRA